MWPLLVRPVGQLLNDPGSPDRCSSGTTSDSVCVCLSSFSLPYPNAPSFYSSVLGVFCQHLSSLLFSTMFFTHTEFHLNNFNSTPQALLSFLPWHFTNQISELFSQNVPHLFVKNLKQAPLPQDYSGPPYGAISKMLMSQPPPGQHLWSSEKSS